MTMTTGGMGPLMVGGKGKKKLGKSMPPAKGSTKVTPSPSTALDNKTGKDYHFSRLGVSKRFGRSNAKNVPI